MAKCSAHGTEVGTVFFTASAKRYMSDGVILKNIGFGWKLYAKAKNSAADSYSAAVETQKAFLAARPALAEYRRKLHKLAGMNTRWKLHSCIELLHDDPDGVWSECCDGYGDNVHADCDEVSEVCRAYVAAIAESESLKAETVSA